MAHTGSHGAHDHGSHGGPIKLNHEPTDIALTGTTRAAIVTFVVIGLVMLVVYGAWGFYTWAARQNDQPLPPLADKDYGHRLPPTPRIQSTPTDDLAHYRATQNGKLAHYAWVDRTAGTVRIPIERAIELTAERASTIADPAAANAATTPAAPAATPATAPATATPTTAAPTTAAPNPAHPPAAH